MIRNTLLGRYRDVELTHVRMNFSRTLDETGRLQVRKVLHLVAVIVAIALARLRHRATVLYYPPAGDDRLPLYRDIAVLTATRWLFDKTVFHFHAGGVSCALTHLPGWVRPLFRRAYFHADLGIRTSALAPEDPRRLYARQERVIPNGVEDATVHLARSGGLEGSADGGRETPLILFVGLLRESKGVLVLLEACGQLLDQGVRFRVDLVGEFHSDDFERRVTDLVNRSSLAGLVRYRGVLVGREKYLAYASAAVLAYPSFFESETFGVVLIEAMQFSLPVVATSWRGIPSVVEDGGNGYLVPIRDSKAVALRLAEILSDPELARRMGCRGRELFEQRYTIERYHQAIQEVFDSLRVCP